MRCLPAGHRKVPVAHHASHRVSGRKMGAGGIYIYIYIYIYICIMYVYIYIYVRLSCIFIYIIYDACASGWGIYTGSWFPSGND